MPALDGIHHVKLQVRDVPRSADWYSRVLGLTVVHRWVEDGVVCGAALRVPGTNVELGMRVVDAGRESSFFGFDPIAFAVAGRAELEAWACHLDALGVAHGPIIEGSVGSLMVVPDPDGIELKLYTGRRADGQSLGGVSPPRGDTRGRGPGGDPPRAVGDRRS
jgi:catechol 2,3-dioxygenase-like lactoylglutathione lyase family enzyme